MTHHESLFSPIRITRPSASERKSSPFAAARLSHAGGGVGGALEFDGATFIAADCVLNPKDGPFSVLAWVKGGAPSQVIVSPQGGANWLTTYPATGALMTELWGGRQGRPLYSDAIMTDVDWHRVAFASQNCNRSLYMDEVLVAADTQVGLTPSDGGLNIGCGKNAEPGAFFTGLIDDVRIYNRGRQTIARVIGLTRFWGRRETERRPFHVPARILCSVCE